jgi:hypothetical protein
MFLKTLENDARVHTALALKPGAHTAILVGRFKV